jgi:DNA (cytosine-5)-methyltransferase 1
MSALLELTTSNLLTSSAVAFLARISVTRERVLDWLARALASGPSTLGSLASFDPDSSSWKTSQRSLLEDSTEFSGTLPLSGTMRSGYLFALLTWERRIGESDSLSWPTPTVHGNHNQKGASAESGDGLATAVRIWPTPTARDWRSGKASAETMNRNSRPLNEVATHWPTPTASMTTEGDLAQAFFRSDDPRRPPCTGGSLNPAWVESIQGFPPGWTEVSPLDHRKSPRHGKRRARSKYAPTAQRD